MSYNYSSTQRPQAHGFYFKNRVPELLIGATEVVRVQLILGEYDGNADTWSFDEGKVVFTGTYSPGPANTIVIDFEDIYADEMKSAFPSSEDFIQLDYLKAWRIYVTNADGAFPLMPIDFATLNTKGTADEALIYLSGNFLTCQPAVKTVYDDSPEFLTYYDPDGDWTIAAEFDDGTRVELVNDSVVGPSCHTIDVSYSRLIELAGQEFIGMGYRVFATDSGGDVVATQRYEYRNRNGMEQYFIFANEMGGYDTLVCDGENAIRPSVTYGIGRTGSTYRQLDDAEDRVMWSQNTGMFGWKDRNWILSVMKAKGGAWKMENGVFVPIVITELDLNSGNVGQLSQASFSYMMSDIKYQ